MAKGTEHLGIGHLVQFYGHDEELTDQVAGYLLGALDLVARRSSSRLRRTGVRLRRG